MVNTAWFDAVVDDLGIAIWRDELPPPANAVSTQDADWNEMPPVAQAGVRLKILSVLSPPSAMKCVVGMGNALDGTRRLFAWLPRLSATARARRSQGQHEVGHAGSSLDLVHHKFSNTLQKIRSFPTWWKGSQDTKIGRQTP